MNSPTAMMSDWTTAVGVLEVRYLDFRIKKESLDIAISFLETSDTWETMKCPPIGVSEFLAYCVQGNSKLCNQNLGNDYTRKIYLKEVM